jgi:replicative DNA helicase
VGSVSVILGATGHGKSTLIGASARAVGLQGDLALVYSFEDPLRFWMQRAIAQESGVHTEAIARRRWLHASRGQLEAARGRLAARTEWVIPAANMTMADVIRDVRARRLRDQAQCGRKRRCAVYVDYVQVVRIADMGRNGTREQGVAQVMDQASWLAQGCGSTDPADECAVIMSSQVKQSVIDEKRAPRMNDGADSFAVGKVAKFMLGINRPAKYDATQDPLRGRLDVLKRNQGDDGVSAEVELHLATHTIRAWTGKNEPQLALVEDAR